MNFLSFSRHLKVIVCAIVWCLVIGSSAMLVASLDGCYTFTGASVPPHLKTLQIPLAEDVSGLGDARNRDALTLRLAQVFRNDNTFVVVQDKGDALLSATITGIQDATASVGGSTTGVELERDRKVTVTIEVSYTDTIKKKKIFEKKSFSQFSVYQVAEGLQGRDGAIQRALRLVCDDVVLAVISGW
jgi:Lipopolysaccharide-assembly